MFMEKLIVRLSSACRLKFPSTMGKLNIAHHKSYHPYRSDNIARVRRDEEEARLKEQVDEGRMLLAVSIFLLLQAEMCILTLLFCTSGCRISYATPTISRRAQYFERQEGSETRRGARGARVVRARDSSSGIK